MMTFVYQAPIDVVKATITSQIQQGSSPGRLEITFFPKDTLYGGINHDRIWLKRPFPIPIGIAQRHFEGKITEADGISTISGNFRFSLFTVIYYTLLASVFWLYGRTYFGNYTATLWTIGCTMMLIAPSWLVFYRKTKAVVEFLSEELPNMLWKTGNTSSNNLQTSQQNSQALTDL